MVWAFIALVSSWNKSATFDEVAHIGAGLTYWKYGDFRMNPEHPPLIKLLATLPVMLLDKIPLEFRTEEFHVRSWFKSDQYRWGYYVLFRTPINPMMVLFHARLVPVAVGVLGGLLAFAWGRILSGSLLGGIFAGLLLLLYPEYAGHSRFVTFDVPQLVGCAAISLAAWQWWVRPGRRSVAFFAVAAALGAMIKLPVLVFCCVQIAVLVLLRFTASSDRITWRQYGHLLLAIALTLYVTIWLFAGFRFSVGAPGIPLEGRSLYAPDDGDYGPGFLAGVLRILWKLRLLPETFLATVSHVQSFGGRKYYLMEEFSTTGWYHYFLVSFALKTSLVLIALYAAGLLTWLCCLVTTSPLQRSVHLQRLAVLGLPFLVLLGLIVLGRANLGHRYILFIYFPLSVITGAAMARWWCRHRVGQALSVVAILYLAIAFARQYPHYATYFNEVVRTPYRGMKYLGDSNVDWGQDFGLAGEELRRRGHRHVNFAAFGVSRPSAYGIPGFRWILPNYPFAIFIEDTSGVELDPGLPAVFSLTALRDTRILYPGLFDREPDWIGNSMVIYYPPLQ